MVDQHAAETSSPLTIPVTTQTVAQFWQGYLATLPADHPHHAATYQAWGFGDSAQMADELGQLVWSGEKTATAGALWDYEDDGDPLPQVGDLSIILDGENNPLCLIEATAVEVRPFDQVEADFAAAEGEGDLSLAYWRDAHRNFFQHIFRDTARSFSTDMPIVCERFRVLHRVPAVAEAAAE